MRLVDQVLIDGEECVKFPFCERKEAPIGYSRPTRLRHGLHLVTKQFARQPPINTFVERNFHWAAAIASSFACSKNATA